MVGKADIDEWSGQYLRTSSRRMGSRPGHRVSRSFHGIRTSMAVLPMAPPFSPGRELKRLDFSSRTRSARGNSASLIPRKGSGFESQEPTSPEVSCIGQIKLKQKWGKAGGAEKVRKENKLSKLKNLVFGKRRQKTEKEEKEDKYVEEACSIQGYPSLGESKQYVSGSYDDKFGNMSVENEPVVANSGLLKLEDLPKATTEEKRASGNSLWKRRSVLRLKTLDVDKEEAEVFEVKKPFTT